MSWVNFKLNKLFFDCRREFDHSSVFDCLPLPDFDMIPYQPREMTLGEQLYQCIRKDSKKQFQKTYLPSNPQITFQQIALKRLSGLTWEDIAKDLDSNPSTLIAFYRRNCKKFREVLDQEIDI